MRRFGRLGLHEREQRRHQDDRDHEIHHDPDRRADAKRPHGDDAARRERQHPECRRRTRAKERRHQVRDRGLERMLRIHRWPPLLVPVLHDVHIVGNGQHDDERHEHAREHVVAVPHERVQAERPEERDEDGEHRQHRLAPGAEREVDRQNREEQDRRRELALVVERDAVVGLADLEAAVVVRAHARGQLRIDDVVDLLDDAGADLVDAVLVEAHDDRRRPAILRDEIAADEVVLERAAPDVGGIARGDVLEERTDLEPAFVWRLARDRVDDGGGGEAVDVLDGVDPFDVAGDRGDRLEGRAREQPIGRVGLERDDERAGAAELAPEPLVVAIDGIVLREPRRDVVVDLGDVGARRLDEGAERR